MYTLYEGRSTKQCQQCKYNNIIHMLVLLDRLLQNKFYKFTNKNTQYNEPFTK